MANSAESENKADAKTWAESLKERLLQLEDAALKSSRIAAQSSKRKRAAINAHLRDALTTFQSQEEQLKAQTAAIEQREAELASRQDLLRQLEQRLETQLDRLDAISKESVAVELPDEFADELAQCVAITVERRIAELLNTRDSLKQDAEAAETESSAQMLAAAQLLEERALSAEDENQVLSRELAEVRDELGLYRQELEEHLERQAVQSADEAFREEQIKQLHSDLNATQQLLSRKTELSESLDKEMTAEIVSLRQELREAEEFVRLLQVELASAKEAECLVSADSESNDRALIEELQAEVASLQTTLMAARADSESNMVGTLADSVHLACEISDLKQQNADLAAQLARLQMNVSHGSPHLNLCQESMSWEDRKRLILQQLEDEGADSPSPTFAKKRVEISEVIAATQSELERREREIQELRSIVEQQSNTRQGVAIGAAAIAQMLDGDELIKQERERLRAIQDEWENKLRQAEIEMSLERAKLARERSQLDEHVRARDAESSSLPFVSETSPNRPVKKAETKSDGKPTRKWLEHLGLKDK